MSILNNITTGVTPHGMRAVIVGMEKIGKTTLATSIPNCILIPLEQGSIAIDCAKTPMPANYQEFVEAIDEIVEYLGKGESFPYKTIVIDSVTALERLIHNFILETQPANATMESGYGGFGKAYGVAQTEFESIISKLDILANVHNINIVFTAHVIPVEITNPESGIYTSYDIQLYSPKNQKNTGKRELLTQWADLIGFLHEKVVVSTAGEGKSKASIGVTTGNKRYLQVSRTPAYVAGNRYDLEGALEIPKENGFKVIADAIKKSKNITIFN